MEWTEELNALLNQCVFASGYDFEASSKLFCEQAAKLRLAENGEFALTGNQCQERWMVLNPTEDDEDEDDLADSPEQHCSEEQQPPPESPSGPNLTDIRPDPLELERDDALDVGPRLELSLTEAELDQLLSTLPPGPEDADVSAADSKDSRLNPASCSEMQWVLAFLTDPNAVACVDADAKNLMSSPEKHDDDNYQVFLQGLQDANLIVPDQLATTRRASATQQEVTARTGDTAASCGESDSDSDASAKDWELTRQAMKRTLQLR